jgi:hypothetical protein
MDEREVAAKEEASEWEYLSKAKTKIRCTTAAPRKHVYALTSCLRVRTLHKIWDGPLTSAKVYSGHKPRLPPFTHSKTSKTSAGS